MTFDDWWKKYEETVSHVYDQDWRRESKEEFMTEIKQEIRKQFISFQKEWSEIYNKADELKSRWNRTWGFPLDDNDISRAKEKDLSRGLRGGWEQWSGFVGRELEKMKKRLKELESQILPEEKEDLSPQRKRPSVKTTRGRRRGGPR